MSLQVGYDSSAHIAEETKNAAVAGVPGGPRTPRLLGRGVGAVCEAGRSRTTFCLHC